jgi:phage protein D
MPSAPIPIYEQRETFYVPHFQIKAQGRSLPDDVVGDVLEITYRDSVQEIDGFELTVNNWDAQRLGFKYEPASDSSYEGLFDVGQKVELSLGYVGDLRLMLRGEITSLQPNFPASGAPTLQVSGQNELHAFRKRHHTHTWFDKRDSEIAEEMRGSGEGDQPGLDVDIRTDAAAKAREPSEPFVFMDNQYDILFLLQRARRRGYTVFLEVDGVTGQKYLSFGPTQNLRDITYTLEWGKSLIDFRPRLSTPNQVRSVTVRGWNRRRKEPIVRTATWGDSGITINEDLRSASSAVRGREAIVVNEPMHTPEEAAARARDLLLTQLKEMVTGSGSTIGLPDLRAGRQLTIAELGPRFSGQYFVTQTTHTLGSSGYRTSFTARREKAAS